MDLEAHFGRLRVRQTALNNERVIRGPETRHGPAEARGVRFKFRDADRAFSTSWPGSSRPSTSLLAVPKTWMAATIPGTSPGAWGGHDEVKLPSSTVPCVQPE